MEIWYIDIKLSAYSNLLQLEACKKPNPTKLQMLHNYFLNWLNVFIKNLAHILFLIISHRDINRNIPTYLSFLITGAFPLSDVSFMTKKERERFLSETWTFVTVLDQSNLDQREIYKLIKESETWPYPRNQERNN
jgi:hypothetical protein